MKTTTMIIAAFALGTALSPLPAIGQTASHPPGLPSPSLQEVDAIVREQMDVSHIPGVAVAIVEHGRPVQVAGYGLANLEWGASVDPDTRFQIASATKLFTAVALMQLVERGSLKLDQPITDYFPDAPDSWRSITVRMLANHTSGLADDPGQPAPRSVEEAVAAAKARPLAYEPGTQSRYGLTDFIVLRAIMEQAAGMALPDMIRTQITDPLGMAATGFPMSADEGPVRTGEVLQHRSSVYGWNGSRQRTSDFFFEPVNYGAGGLYSTARDLARFCAALDSGELISAGSMAELTTPAVLRDGAATGFGIGWTVKAYRGEPVVGHSGGPALADILRVPSRGLSIIVLTNQQLFYPMLAERIADLYLPERAVPALEDTRPHLAERFARALGSLDPSTEASGHNALAPLRSPFGQAFLTAAGPLQSVTLLADKAIGDRVERRYLARFQRKSHEFLAETNGEGLLVGVRPG